MKILPLLALPFLFSSCALVQLPARLINQVIAPLTENIDENPVDGTIRIALTMPAGSAR